MTTTTTTSGSSSTNERKNLSGTFKTKLKRTFFLVQFFLLHCFSFFFLLRPRTVCFFCFKLYLRSLLCNIISGHHLE